MKIFQDVTEPEVIMVYQLWKSKAALKAYMKSSSFHRMLEVFEMCSKEPELHIIEHAKQSGMEWIKSVLMADIEE